ncbi:polyphosphate kinase 2 family protein [Minwuia sp.]|uniref:polyphosphate kinase 2 family protein n=1 Tax=Minwuia sp. TaxID=2493630 RepID=UPI003A93509B
MVKLSDVDLSLKISKDVYREQLSALQHRLRTIELAYRRDGLRALIVFEGWDAAGKGGTIRRLVAEMDPRGFQVWPIAAPRPQFQGRHYLERFWSRLPEPGILSIFDRSWYGRVLVERVEGLATEDEWRRAYDEINGFESMLTADDVRIVKLFIHISEDEQAARFKARLDDPWKRWKLTVEDFRNSARREPYETAIDDMLARTSSVRAPWHVVPGEQKRYARIDALTHVADCLGRGVDLNPPDVDPDVAELARQRFS